MGLLGDNGSVDSDGHLRVEVRKRLPCRYDLTRKGSVTVDGHVRE